MDNFKKFGGPGGLKGRKEFIGGRPKSDADYGAKKVFRGKQPGFGSGKPSFGGRDGASRGGDRGAKSGFDRGGDRGGDRRPVEMHKATCSTCGKACEVPFRPDGSKPVLCSECFGKNKSDDRNGNDRRSSFESRDRSFGNDRPKRDFEARTPRQDSPDYTALVKQMAALEVKMNEVISLMMTQIKSETKIKPPIAVEKGADMGMNTVTDTPAKIRKPKKATVAKKVAKKAAAKKVAKKVTKKK